MAYTIKFVFLVSLLLCLAGCSWLPQPGPSPTLTVPAPTAAPTHTVTPTQTPTGTPTPPPTETPIPTATRFPTLVPGTAISATTVDRLALLRQIHAEGAVDGLSLQPGGSFVTYSNTEGYPRMMDLSSGTEAYSLDGAFLNHTCQKTIVSSYALAFSPDGKLLATTGPDGVQVWEAAAGKIKYTFPFFNAAHVVFSPDGSLLAAGICAYAERAAGNITEGITIWEMQNGKPVQVLEGHLVEVENASGRGLVNAIYDLRFTPDGKELLTGGPNLKRSSGVKIWDIKTGDLVQEFDCSPYTGTPAVSLDLNPAGTQLLTLENSLEPTARLWKFRDGKIVGPKPVKVIKTGRPYAVARFNHKGDLIFALSPQPLELAIFSVEEEKQVFQQVLEPGPAEGEHAEIGLDISADDSLLAVAGWTGVIHLFGIP